MSKITVGWSPYLESDYQKGLAFFANKPINLYDTHMKQGSHRYKLCPATKDLAYNTFIVRSPFDAHFILDADKKTIEFISPYIQPIDFYFMREVKLTNDLKSIITSAKDAKYYQPRCPLKTLYGLFNKYKKKPKLEFID